MYTTAISYVCYGGLQICYPALFLYKRAVIKQLVNTLYSPRFSARQLEISGEKPRVIVATMKQKSIFSSRQASLQIDATGMLMLNLIVITWVYVEHKRREQKKEKKHAMGTFLSGAVSLV